LNASETSVDFEGWFLKDENNQWQFPSGISLEPGDTLVVFASGKNRNNDQNYLHTNFELNRGGDYLALVQEDGITVEHEVGAFSGQRMDISLGLQGQKTSLISPAASAKYIVPSSDIGTDWRGGNEPYSESGWSAATTSIGYSTLMDPNLQAYYAFDGSNPSTVTDSSNYGRTGTINGATRTGNGKIGGALDFDGESSWVGISIPGYMQQMTLSMWINFDFVSEPNPPEGTFVSPISHVGEEISAFSFIINSWGYLRFTVIGQSDECKLVSSDTISLDTWHHIVITYDNINHLGQIYFDGRLEGFTENTVGPVLVGDSTIGMSNYEGFCDAQFDEVAIWNRILDQDEITNLSTGVSAGNIYLYDDLINTDIQAQMQSSNASVYTRCAFNVTDLSDIEYLTLKMQYDDGFMAFLNGTEVTSRNAPSSVQWDSAATSSRPNKDCNNLENINLTSYIDLLKTGTNILAIQGLNISASDEDFLLSPQLYGYTLSADTNRYFTEPSPGELNDDGYIDLVADTIFSHDRGYYDSAFNVTINCNTDGATIRYTLDGSEPSEIHGSTYTSPININTTTCLRAAAFKSGWLPSNIDTHTYIFASDVATQPANPPGMPSTWKDGYPADYEVDPGVVTLPGYGIEDALLSIPTISIVTDHDHLWSEETGIYYNDSPENEWSIKEQNKRLWERPTSIEFIYPANNDGYQIDCGIRIHGAITRSHDWTPKHSFRLFFRGDYDNKKLVYPLFPDSDVDSFDQIVLRSCSGNSWTGAGGNEEATYIEDQWMRDTSPDLGQPGSHGIFSHVFLNGLYWGVYNPCERLHDSFWAEHVEGDKAEYDVLKDWVELHSGSIDAWNQMIDLASQGLESEEAYQKIQGNNPDGTRNLNYPVLVDVENLIDYMIPHIHSNAVDWAGHNWWGARRRGPESEGFKFGIWDQEGVFGIEGRGWQTTPAEEVDDMGPAYVYDKLRRNEKFKMKFADRVHKYMFNNGALTVAANQKRWTKRVNEIDRAIVGESARWGDIWDYPPYTREDNWLYAVDDINSWYFPEVHLIALERFKNVGLYPDVNSPSFHINGQYQHGGYITPPASLTILAPAGTIYYTTDANDPYEPFKVLDTNIILTEDALKKVLIPTVSNPSGTDWRTSTSYNDSSWTDYILTGAGTGGVGYGLNGEYEDYISYNVESVMVGVNTSCYIRMPFSVTAGTLSEFNTLKFNIRYDDGFIAYLNGTQIAAENYSGTQWYSHAEGMHGGDIFEEYDITGNIGQLGVGDNLLAIHGLINPLNTPELIVAYNFEGNLSDVSGNGYTGVGSTSPAPSYTSDAHSSSTGTQCLLLNGSNYVEIPLLSDNPFDGSQDFTIVAWIRTPSSTGVALLSCSDGTPDGPTEHPMSMWYDWIPGEDGVTGGMSYDNWWAGQVGSSQNAVSDGAWHHVAITYEESTNDFQMYIDGDPDGSGNFDPSIPSIATTTIRIGLPIHDWDGPLGGWDGKIDELGIFDRALSQQQIQNIMSNGLLSPLG
ncbi:MAG: LamG-like jellyroll fold domain-containing protein, partial [Dehalococcoidales bacterium]